MPTASAPGESSAPKSARTPSYELGKRDGEIFARFASGKRVQVLRGRERVYPGLTSVAPSMLPFYEVFADHISGKHVLDAGSGSSVGTLVLCERVAHVTALDNDARALDFGREYAPSAEFLHTDLCHGLPVDRADAAVVADVLAHVARPEAVLRGLRACLPVGSQLFVAEGKAYPGQHLLAPARRAFSARSLTRLLLRSGFELDEEMLIGSSFLALVARRGGDSELDALVEGFHQFGRGEPRAARAELARARSSARADIRLEALLGEAEAAFALNDGDASVRAYFEANGLDAEDGRALAGLARIALATGEFEDALRLSLDSLQRDATEPLANMTAAIAAEQLTHPGAFDAWRVSASLAPDDPEVATGLARLAAASQNYGFAIQAFERLRTYGGPLGVEFHVTLGWLLLADGRKNDAATEARYAAALEPKNEAVAELLAATHE